MLLGSYDGNHRWHFRQDGPAGGGTDVAEDGAEGAVVEGEGSEGEEGAEVVAEEGAEAVVEGSDGEGEPPSDQSKVVPIGKKPTTTKASGPPSSIPYSRFKAMSDKLNDLELQLQTATRAPQVDAMDTLLERLPKGEDGTPERQTYEDAKALAPIIKALRPALIPEIDTMRAITAGTLQAIDRIRFEIEQILEAMPEKSRPASLKKENMERLQKIRNEVFERTGGKRLMRHADAFGELQEQLKEEAAQASATEGTIRADERGRTVREITTRNAAGRAGAPRPAAAVPRGGGAPGSRSLSDIRRAVAAGQDFRIG